jgi:hypothetical protein
MEDILYCYEEKDRDMVITLEQTIYLGEVIPDNKGDINEGSENRIIELSTQLVCKIANKLRNAINDNPGADYYFRINLLVSTLTRLDQCYTDKVDMRSFMQALKHEIGDEIFQSSASVSVCIALSPMINRRKKDIASMFLFPLDRKTAIFFNHRENFTYFEEVAQLFLNGGTYSRDLFALASADYANFVIPPEEH